MKKISIIISLLLSLVTISCSSCAKKTPNATVPDAAPSASTTVTPVPPPPAPTTITVKGDSWEFVLPADGWKALNEAPTNSTAFVNPTKNNLVVMVSEAFPGTYDQYVIMAVRGAKDAGATIKSTKQVEVNGHKFVLIESSKDNISVWMWVSLVNGQGYTLACGGPTDPAQQELCTGIASTLKING